ncbi:MAG: molecular chaperone TorD family protein [Caldilineaceae bacterium]
MQSEQVSATYHAVGYLSTQRGGAPDHLGEEFGLLAHLCAAEAEAWIDKRVAIAQRMQREQVQFLQRHLLRWLAPCAVAICRHDNHFFTELTNIAVDLIANHFAVVTLEAAR